MIDLTDSKRRDLRRAEGEFRQRYSDCARRADRRRAHRSMLDRAGAGMVRVLHVVMVALLDRHPIAMAIVAVLIGSIAWRIVG